MKHSKTPWHCADDGNGYRIYDNNNESVIWPYQDTVAIEDEDAKHIVKCVNNHDALVEFVQDFEDGENSLKHNSAQSVSDKWAEQTSGTAGWSDKAVMAFAYKDLREKHQQLLSKLGEE